MTKYANQYHFSLIKMSLSEIYSDFSEDINLIIDTITKDSLLLHSDLSNLNEYFLKKRLIILRDEDNYLITKSYDPEIGKPIPYIILWLSNAVNYTDIKTIRKIALALLYSSIATTIRDDIIDNEIKPSKEALQLYDYYYYRYLSSFDFIDDQSHFWHILSKSITQHKEYEQWALLYNPETNLDPFTDKFLEKSSQYFSAVVLPSMTSIAYISKNESIVKHIREFLSAFSKAWRLYDDLVDWEKDISKKNYNLNSILLKAQTHTDSHLDKEKYLSILLEEEFIRDVYARINYYLRNAQKNMKEFEGYYLSKFLDEQINFHKRREIMMLEKSKQIMNNLKLM